MNERDPVKLQGLHGRLRAKMSRSDGALSYAMPYAYKTKFNDPRKRSSARASQGSGSARASQGSVQIMNPQATTQPVAPSATVAQNNHTPPSVEGKTDGAGAGKKKRLSVDQRMAQENQLLRYARPNITRQQTYTERLPTPEAFEEQQRIIERLVAQSPNVRRLNSTSSRLNDRRQLFK